MKEGGDGVIETERLVLREWTADDLPDLKRFLQDAEVMWAYEHAFSNEEVSNWLQWNLDSYQANGYGLWAMLCKSTGEIIGECGITQQTVEGTVYPEIGYHLVKTHWHQGFAVEAARAVKDWGFKKKQFPELVSTIRDTNLASMNVAIRNGMIVKKRFIKQYRGIEMPHYLFGVKKDARSTFFREK
ncbi:GNAT family N-acetyltransferase [Candidatus Enterococcus ferrettii]|uniref:GNAT family N-acetyltransferase n=1 Tax=Candidatus Enterococcus ferrettii TaxID=2815324 RepID=UPI001A9BA962|nr:GNAT family N-acetyltransferase [Enterococcus sp. 665A]MBO1338667.1 GNAT family N-acetyltransferase [Enterococcus sp. 665A]